MGGGQPVYDISPERFQRIMAGEPLTNEEIAQMIGGGESVAPVATMGVGGSAAFPPAAGSVTLGATAVEAPATLVEQVPLATTEAQNYAAPEPLAASKKEKKSSKKSSKKKLSSKKKAKGCC